MHSFPPTAQLRLSRFVFVMAAAATFAMAVVVGTDSLSSMPHPTFLHGIIHEDDHGALHFWND